MEIIHIVLGKANPERMNGVNKVVYQLATKQVEFGEKVSVWGITKDLKNNHGERNFKTSLFLKKINPFGIPFKMEKAIIEKKNKAIFHVHGGWIPVFYAIGNLFSKHKITFIFTPHGAYNSIAMNRNFWIKRVYFSFFEKKLLQNASKIHCIGKSETVGLKFLYQNSKTILVSYGFENKADISFDNSKNEHIIFGFIGRLDIYTKGLDTLIKAFKRFVKTNPKAQLWIIGDSNEREKLNKMIVENNLSKNTTLFGGKFGKEKEDLLQTIDVFVHPSRNEGLPTSVIEAASFGKPCIVTHATNVGDLITAFNAGDMIYKQNSNDLAESMEKLSFEWKNEENFNKIRRNAIRMIEENFNWEKIIKEFNTEIYNK